MVNNTALETRKVSVEELASAGFGKVNFKAKEYLDFAKQASQSSSGPFAVRVEVRPWDLYVDPPWRQRSYAHAK